MPDLPQRSILVVEDDPCDSELLLRALSKRSFTAEVAVARDGVEVLDYLHARGKFQGRPRVRPLLVILDLKMPRVTGLEVLRRLKGDSEFKLVPVLMFTSSRQPADVLGSYLLGANGYVVKPVDSQEFEATVIAMCRFWLFANEPPPVEF